jgi:hypothetical protein
MRTEDSQKAMPYISKTPKPPYYAVVFTSINANVDHTEHVEMYARLVQRAARAPGSQAQGSRDLVRALHDPYLQEMKHD